MNIKDSYIHNGTAVLKDIKVESSVLKKILAGKDANDAYLDWETVCDLTGIKPTAAGTADKVAHQISFKNTSNTTIEFDGSANKDLTGGLYFSKISERVHDNDYHDYSHRRTSGNLNFADCGLRYFLATSSMTTGKPAGDAHILHMAWDNGKWEGQLALPTATNGVMQWRTQGSSDDWADWVTLLDSLNYTSYTVKKDGTGASGTWGINITGKLSKKLTFTGGVTGDWDGSADKTVAIPTKASWDYDDVYLKLAGNGTTNPMTGTIYMDNVDGLIINSHNKNLNIWEVYGNSGSWASQFGFNLQYYGVGSGNDNDLILWAHAQNADTHVEVYRVHQDGSFIFKAVPKVGTNTVYHAGNLSIGTLMGSTAIGDSDEPVYWSGSAFVKASAYPTKASWNYDDVYLKDVLLDTGNSTDKNKGVSLTNGNVYLKLFKTVNGAESEDSKVKIYGATNVSVTTDSSGDIKITGVDSVGNADSLGGVAASQYFKNKDLAASSEWIGRYLYTLWDNQLYAADKRLSVTVSGITSSVATLFNGNFEDGIALTSTTTTINIRSTTQNAVWTDGLPYGSFYVVLYNSTAENITARVYSQYSGHGIGWHNLTSTKLNTYVWRLDNGYYQISDLEITITKRSQDSSITLCQIMHYCTRPAGPYYMAAMSKYCDQVTKYNITANKFIGPLQGNADTSTNATYAANVGTSSDCVTAAQVKALHTWYTEVAGSNASGVIDNWNEIKNFIDGFNETDDLATYLTSTFLAKSGGTMTGQLKWTDNTALPEQQSPQYFVCIDAFNSGGTTKWASKANTLKALTGLTSTAVGDSDEPVYWDGSKFVKAGAYPTKASWNYDDVYLKLTGGTLSNSVPNILTLKRTDTSGGAFIDYYHAGQTTHYWRGGSAVSGAFVFYADASTETLAFTDSSITYKSNKIWHEGNDGADSGLDADLLDGNHASYFHIQTARNYTTVDALPSEDSGWYNVFTISDTSTGCAICSVRAYAHSSMTFIVSKGYTTNATLQILQFNNSSNGSYFYAKGARVLSDGKVQVLFNKPAANNQSYVSVDINIFSTTGTIRPNATLTLETSTLTNSTSPSIVKSLNGTGGKITSDVVGNLAGNATTATSADSATTATTATTATNLTNAPSLLIDGNTIAVKAGEKTSSYITVPYATSAGDAGTLSSYAESDFWRKRGTLYQNNGYNANTLGVGGYQFVAAAYGHTGSGAAHANALSENSTIEVFANLQLSTVAWSDDVSYRVKWGGETNPQTRPNAWSSWIKLLSSGNYTSYVNTTNFPGLDKTGTVTSVTVTGANGISGSGTVTTSGTITLSNSGVRAVSINGDHLRVNTNGTDADLDIPNSDKTDGFHINSWGWPYKYYKKITNTVCNQTWYVKLTLGGYAQWKYFVIYTSYNNCNGPVIVKRTGFGSGLEIEYMNTNGNHVVAVCYDAVYHSSEHKNVIFLQFDAIQDSNHYSPSSSADVELWSDCEFTMTNLGASAPTLSNGAKWINTVNGGKAYHGATNHAGTIYPNETNTYDLGTSSLKWANIYATTLNGSLAWSNLTGVPTILETVTSDTHSYSVSNASWTSTITLPTDAGSYVLTMITGNSTLTGVFSIGSGDTAKDEINLHLHGSGPRLYARTNGTKLEISSNDDSTQNRSVIIKYKRLT